MQYAGILDNIFIAISIFHKSALNSLFYIIVSIEWQVFLLSWFILSFRIGLQVYTFFFLSPERASTYQRRATPWVKINQYLSPVIAQHKDKLKRTHSKNVTPLPVP